MAKPKDPVREKLLKIAAGQERVREQLAALAAQQLPPVEALPIDEDLPEQTDLATERRAVIECILHDLLPVIDDLRAAANYRPGQSTQRRAGRS